MTAYGGLALAWWAGWHTYKTLFLVVGLVCTALTLFATAYFGRFEGKVRQRKSIVLRQRYWLFYSPILPDAYILGSPTTGGPHAVLPQEARYADGRDRPQGTA